MIRSPYQQNINIMKDFFRKPIILALSIVLFTNVLFQIASFFFSSTSYLYKINNALASTVSDYSSFNALFSSGLSISIIKFILALITIPSIVFTVLVAVSFLLFYQNSKKPDASLSKPSSLFRVLSLIELIISIAFAAICFIAAFIALVVVITYGARNSYDNNILIIVLFIFPFMVIAFVFGLVITMNAAQYKYADSIKKSVDGNFLLRKGAFLFGIFSLIYAAMVLMSVTSTGMQSALSMVSPSSTIQLPVYYTVFTCLNSLVSGAVLVLQGVVALQYSSYIKKFT